MGDAALFVNIQLTDIVAYQIHNITEKLTVL